MKTDARLVVRKMTLIAADLEEIARLADRSREDYLRDLHAQVRAERYVERVIGRMIDINFHLITTGGGPPPKDYYQSFMELGRLGILPAELARVLAASTGLRNRIAHEYEDIDHARVHEGLNSATRDLPAYLRHVQAYLDAQSKA